MMVMVHGGQQSLAKNGRQHVTKWQLTLSGNDSVTVCSLNFQLAVQCALWQGHQHEHAERGAGKRRGGTSDHLSNTLALIVDPETDYSTCHTDGRALFERGQTCRL